MQNVSIVFAQLKLMGSKTTLDPTDFLLHEQENHETYNLFK